MTAITAWGTHRAGDGWFVMTDERDCLPPDCYEIVRYEYPTADSALECVQRVQGPFEMQVDTIYAVRDETGTLEVVSR